MTNCVLTPLYPFTIYVNTTKLLECEELPGNRFLNAL